MPVHLHPGPEAWYVLEGSQCVETAQGARVVRARESLVVPAGRPMLLATVGTTVRRTLAVVLHEASQPWTIPTTTWTPPGKCPR
jgi:quercetin dioxygenase-like cupin family protein